jgi:hypothetical protein
VVGVDRVERSLARFRRWSMGRGGGKNVSGGALRMSREIVESAAPARLRVVTLRDVAGDIGDAQ